ncbi:MAG: DUF2214 domain-containing protein [Pseudomonadota bacterium]
MGTIVSSTVWGYPIVLSLHAIGMATMVGVSLMLALRVLGFASDVPVAAIAAYWRVALCGLALNLASGAALFSGDSSTLFFNWAFRIKLLFVAVGLALTWRLVRVCVLRGDDVCAARRMLAGAAMSAWIAAIVSGRLIGYSA